MFLPMLMIDLRERFSKAESRIQDKLSPVSQLVVIYQILGEPVRTLLWRSWASG